MLHKYAWHRCNFSPTIPFGKCEATLLFLRNLYSMETSLGSHSSSGRREHRRQRQWRSGEDGRTQPPPPPGMPAAAKAACCGVR